MKINISINVNETLTKFSESKYFLKKESDKCAKEFEKNEEKKFELWCYLDRFKNENSQNIMDKLNILSNDIRSVNSYINQFTLVKHYSDTAEIEYQDLCQINFHCINHFKKKYGKAE